MRIEDSFQIVYSGFQIIYIASWDFSLADRIEANASYIRFFAVRAFWEFLIAAVLEVVSANGDISHIWDDD